ncbi:MAG: glycoside hydrolase family 9 protein [Nocardioides sp.]
MSRLPRQYGVRGALVVGVAAALAATSAPHAGAVKPSGKAEAAPSTTVRVPLISASDDVKVATIGSSVDLVGDPFTVLGAGGAVALTGELEAVPASPQSSAPQPPRSDNAPADLSRLTAPGTYTVRIGGPSSATSDPFVVQDAPYGDVLSSLLTIYNSNADGREKSNFHKRSHLNDKASQIANGPKKGTKIDVTGGWMDSGDQLKFTTTIGYATTMLQVAARVHPGRRDQLNAIADIGVRWLLKAHPRRGVFVSQVGHTNTDHNAGFRDPASDDKSSTPKLSNRPTYVLTTQTGGSDVAAIASTALSLAAQRTSTGAKRTKLVTAAKAWFNYAKKLKGPWKNCCYQQDTWLDDVAAAQVELGLATGNADYLAFGLGTLNRATGGGTEGFRVLMDGFEMAGLPAAELCGLLGVRPELTDAQREQACDVVRSGGQDAAYKASLDPFGRTAPYNFGTVRGVIAGGLSAFLAAQAGQSGARRVAMRGWGWFLGANPWGRRWQAGYGVQNPYHWAFRSTGAVRPAGAVVGGPAPVSVIEANNISGPYVPGPYDTAEVGYRDDPRDYVTNEVGIPYNAPGVLMSALLAARP